MRLHQEARILAFMVILAGFLAAQSYADAASAESSSFKFNVTDSRALISTELKERIAELFEYYSRSCELMNTISKQRLCKKKAMALAKKDAKDMTVNDEAQKDEYGFYMAPIDETTGSAEFMNPKQFCRKIYDWVSGSSTGTLSTCVNELNIPGHLMPQTTSSDLTSSNVTEAMCNSLGESTCYGTSGCAFQNNICFSAVTNEHCDNYSTEKKCNADKADACYWGTPNNGTEPQCMLRLQYCGQYTDAEQCVDVDGCMWYNDLQNGQSGGPSDSSHRGRCMADMCARINNGRCTIQHTGGRCVWYTKEQNLAYRGKDFPGCYLSPCNNRFTKDSCSSASETDPYYDCVWCKNYPDTILGCQNAKTGSLAQCWNVQDSNPEAYPIQGSGCTRCMGELTADGICKGTQRNPNACFEKCCASSACICFSGDLTSFTDGTTTSGLNVFSTPSPTSSPFDTQS